MQPNELKEAICKILDDNKAVDITVLDVNNLTVLADYMVICTAKSTKQVRGLAETLEGTLEDQGVELIREEGTNTNWAILDYGSVLVNIFNDEMRTFYCLEKLWTDGNNITKYQGK